MDIVVKMDRFQILQNAINVKYTLGEVREHSYRRGTAIELLAFKKMNT